MNKLNLDRDLVDQCRELADEATRPINSYVNRHSTVAVERAILRLLGFNTGFEVQGALEPVANLIIEKISRRDLGAGVATLVASIKQRYPRWPQDKMAEKIIRGEVNIERLESMSPETADEILKPWTEAANAQLDRMRSKHGEHRARTRHEKQITKISARVGSGDAHDDARQIDELASHGVNVIELNRSSGQSLLDYVPCGITTEGYGGTFVTQENLRFMRESVIDASEEYRRSFQLVANGVGLCSPEIAVISAFERLDMMVSDALAAVLTRDVNMKRAFIDEQFTRYVLNRAGMGVWSSTQDYIFRDDCTSNLHEVVASLFINESLSKQAGLWDEKVGLSFSAGFDGPALDLLTNELLFALLIRELFSRCSVQYVQASPRGDRLPWMTEAKERLFCLIGLISEQDYLQVKGKSLPSMVWMRDAAGALVEELSYLSNGKIMRQARQILERAHRLLKRTSETSLFDTIEAGQFLGVARAKDQGRGLDGVFEKGRNYFNPFAETNGNNNRR